MRLPLAESPWEPRPLLPVGGRKGALLIGERDEAVPREWNGQSEIGCWAGWGGDDQWRVAPKRGRIRGVCVAGRAAAVDEVGEPETQRRTRVGGRADARARTQARFLPAPFLLPVPG